MAYHSPRVCAWEVGECAFRSKAVLQTLRGEFGLLHGSLLDVEGPAAAARLLGVRVGEEEAATDNLVAVVYAKPA